MHEGTDPVPGRGLAFIVGKGLMAHEVFHTIDRFLKKDIAPGVLLFMAAILALTVENSPLSWLYDTLLSTPVEVKVGALEIAKPLLLWINDGLMALFFFLVGLEIKREVVDGELSSFDKALLPIIAAIGGMALPALIYAGVAWNDPVALTGWAIPAATDIAFALGILAVLGSRVPVSLKVFLLSVAVIDDLGAIVIIALFYTANLSVTSLLLGGIGLCALIALNRNGVRNLVPYVIIGLMIWVCFLKSGVHATLAGVLIAFTIPMGKTEEDDHSPLHDLEHGLHPWVAFLVLPAFAFANAGVPLTGLSFEALAAPIPLGIILGLVIGKQLGVFGATWAAVKLGWVRLPENVGWREIYGVACLTGIGFTMSLFIGTLAFDTADQLNQVRLGVLIGSIISGTIGYIVLRQAIGASGKRRTMAPERERPQAAVDVPSSAPLTGPASAAATASSSS